MWRSCARKRRSNAPVSTIATGALRARPNERAVVLSLCSVGECVEDEKFAGAKCICNHGFEGNRCESGPRPLIPNEEIKSVVPGGRAEQCVQQRGRAVGARLAHWLD